MRAVGPPPRDVVYAGFSLGALPAQKLAQTRPGARGALLMHACIPVSEFGAAWPEQVPVQVHAMEDDPFFTEDADAARALVAEAPCRRTVPVPRGPAPFADRSLPSHDAEAAGLLTRRAVAFLGSLDGGTRA